MGRRSPAGPGSAGLYRTLLAGRSVLVVLDNAAGEEQVRSLLPGDGGCGALLTSRAPLAGIEGAHMIGVGVLSAAQGIELLSRIAGRDRVAADPHAAEAIVASCGRLPLALRVAGARLAGRPWWSLAQLGERLADEHKRLDELVAGDLAVRASLALSYQSLAGDSQRLFRLLACLDAPNVGGWVAAALLDTDLPGAERLMEALVDVHLLEIAGEGPPGWLRYRFHDLVRVFARERAAAARELGEEQPAALGRALSGWLALAEQADRRLPSNVYGVGHGRAPRWRLAAATTDSLLADPLAWLDAERVAMVAVVGQAADAGLDELAADLAASLVNFLDLRRYFDDWQRSHDAALAVSRRRGNRRGEASLLRGLGYLSLNRNSLDAAMNCLGRAHRILGQIGDRRGKAQAVEGIGVLHRLQGRYAEAASCYDQAMAAFLDLGDRHGEAWTRFAVGVLHDERGELAAALAELTRALELFGELGELRGAAWTQRRLGVVYSARGDLDCAAAWLERALAGLRGLGDRAAEACTLRSLGELHLRGDARDKARRLLQDSLAIASDLDDRFFEAQVLRSLGDLHHLEANQAEAARCLNRSAEIWRQLDMPSAGSDARALILSTLYPAADPAGFLPTRPGGPWRRPELAAAAVMISCLFRNGGNVRRGRKPVSVWHGGRTAAVRPCGGELSRHAARGRRFHDRGGFPVIVTGRSPRS